jgi:2-(1,2-epoxy-1,2-dihydrophenyl)acetyl-CoA isomerase
VSEHHETERARRAETHQHGERQRAESAATISTVTDLNVTFDAATNIGIVEVTRGPNNYFDAELIGAIADEYEQLENNQLCRAIVLCAEGKHFCAGAILGEGGLKSGEATAALYAAGARLFAGTIPVVAAIQGAAIGGGLGLALSADFRIATPISRFTCNFSRLGFHHGFGLTVTLPGAVGQQRALELLYTGGSVNGAEALRIGLCDRLVEPDQLRTGALEFAGLIAAAAPLAVRAIKATMRGDLADRVRLATAREAAEQAPLRETQDHAEGVLAAAERRDPVFTGR